MNRLLKRALAFLFLLPVAFASPGVSSADSGNPTTAVPTVKPSSGSGALRQTGPGAAQATLGFFTSPSTVVGAGAATARGGVPGSCCDTMVSIGGSIVACSMGAVSVDSGILRCGRINDGIE